MSNQTRIQANNASLQTNNQDLRDILSGVVALKNSALFLEEKEVYETEIYFDNSSVELNEDAFTGNGYAVLSNIDESLKDKIMVPGINTGEKYTFLVTLDGARYVCEPYADDGFHMGDPNFETYPFVISAYITEDGFGIGGGGFDNTYMEWDIIVPQPETISLKIERIISSEVKKVIVDGSGDDVTEETFDEVGATTEEIGDIKVTARTDLGDEWMLCDGSAIDESLYPELYNKLGFGVNGSLAKTGPTFTGSIYDVYVDELCTVIGTIDSNKKPYLYWKLHTSQSWSSKNITLSNSHGAVNIKISLCNNYLCALIQHENYSGSRIMDLTYCTRDSFSWPTAHQVCSDCSASYGSFTKLRYLNGYYCFGYVQTNSYIQLGYGTNIASSFTYGSRTGSGSAVYDVFYYDGKYHLYIKRSSYSMVRSSSTSIGMSGYSDTNENGPVPPLDVVYSGNDIYYAYYRNSQLTISKNFTDIGTINIAESPIASNLNGNDLIIMTPNYLVKYNLITNEAEIGKMIVESTRASINWEKEKVCAASSSEYRELVPGVPKIEFNGVKAYIKAKG